MLRVLVADDEFDARDNICLLYTSLGDEALGHGEIGAGFGDLADVEVAVGAPAVEDAVEGVDGDAARQGFDGLADEALRNERLRFFQPEIRRGIRHGGDLRVDGGNFGIIGDLSLIHI